MLLTAARWYCVRFADCYLLSDFPLQFAKYIHDSTSPLLYGRTLYYAHVQYTVPPLSLIMKMLTIRHN